MGYLQKYHNIIAIVIIIIIVVVVIVLVLVIVQTDRVLTENGADGSTDRRTGQMARTASLGTDSPRGRAPMPDGTWSSVVTQDRLEELEKGFRAKLKRLTMRRVPLTLSILKQVLSCEN